MTKIESTGSDTGRKTALKKGKIEHVLSYFAMGCIMPGLAILLAWYFGFPVPFIHDEFSYLFMAETFAKGRLNNVPHPFAEFFQTFHIIHANGVYASKYFPGIGLQLLIGKWLGHPIAGVWLTIGVFGTSLLFILRHFFSKRTALIVSSLCCFQFMVISYFGHSYWGGSLATLAGVWILGGAVLAAKSGLFRYSWMSGSGLFICILTRPFEGLFYVLPLAAWIGIALLRKTGNHLLNPEAPTFLSAFSKISPQRRRWTGMSALQFFFYEMNSKNGKWNWSWRLAIPIGLCAVAGMIGLGAYNRAITGKWTLFPHTMYEQIYTPHGVRFLWENDDGNREMEENRAFFESLPKPFHQLREHYLREHQNRTENFLMRKLQNASNVILFHFPLSLSWMFIVAIAAPEYRRNWLWQLCLLTFLMRVAPFLLSWSSKLPHYGAYWIFPYAVICAFGLDYLFRRETAKKWAMTGAVISIGGLLAVYAQSFQGAPEWKENWTSYSKHGDRLRNRITLEKFLTEEMSDVKHVVFVTYSDRHDFHSEWVYNSPNIDEQKIVWAHDLGEEKNSLLIDYYADRSVWKIDADASRNRALQRWNKSRQQFEAANLPAVSAGGN